MKTTMGIRIILYRSKNDNKDNDNYNHDDDKNNKK